MPTATLQERFDASVSIEPNSGCWLWTGRLNSKSYAMLSMKYKTSKYRLASHISKELGGQPRLSESHLALHKCDTPQCVNPDHLYWGTHQQNADDKVNRRRHHQHSQTACARGHEFTEENTLFKDSRNKRICRTCARRRSMNYYYKKTGREGGAPCPS